MEVTGEEFEAERQITEFYQRVVKTERKGMVVP